MKEFITANIKRDKDSLFVRSYPDYPMSRIPLHTRHGEGKNKVEEYLDYVMAGEMGQGMVGWGKGWCDGNKAW